MAAPVPFRWFGAILPIALAGYLFFDRTFAYLHIPGTPLFVGEVVLLIGVFEAFRGRRIIVARVRRSLVLQMLVLFILVGLLRLLLVDLRVYGILAVRDSALWYYGLFTPLVVILLQVRPEWLAESQARYARLIPVFLAWAPIAVVLERMQPVAWTVPDSFVSVTSFRPGNVGVHVALMMAYIWLVDPGTTAVAHRRRMILTAMGLFAVMVVGTQNRAGLVAASLGLALAWLLTPLRTRLTLTAGYALLVIVAVPAILNLSIKVEGRDLSVAQIAQNASSIVLGSRAEGSLGDNVDWRQRLWSLAVNDLFDSGEAMFGFGYGPNIAARYSFSNPDAVGTLRNPHNSHLSVLVRMGIVGAVVWLALWAIWLWAIVQAMARSDPFQLPLGLRIWTWTAIGTVSMLVNAFFDPTLEGPQVGIWLWTLVGIGIHQQSRLSEPRTPADTSVAVPRQGRAAAAAR